MSKKNISKIEENLRKNIKTKFIKYDKSAKIYDLKFNKTEQLIDNLFDKQFFEFKDYSKFPSSLYFNFPNFFSLSLRYRILKLVADLNFSFWTNDNSINRFDSKDLNQNVNLVLKNMNNDFSIKKKIYLKIFPKYENKLFAEFVLKLKERFKKISSYKEIPKLKERFYICDLHLKNLDTFGQDPFYKKRNLFLMYKFIEISKIYKEDENASRLKHDILVCSDNNYILEFIRNKISLIPIDYHIPRSLYLLGFFDCFTDIKELFESKNSIIFNERDPLIFKMRGISEAILSLIIYKFMKYYLINNKDIEFMKCHLINNKDISLNINTSADKVLNIFDDFKSLYFSPTDMSKIIYYYYMPTIMSIDSILFTFSKFSDDYYNSDEFHQFFKHDPTNVDFLKVDTINF